MKFAKHLKCLFPSDLISAFASIIFGIKRLLYLLIKHHMSKPAVDCLIRPGLIDSRNCNHDRTVPSSANICTFPSQSIPRLSIFFFFFFQGFSSTTSHSSLRSPRCSRCYCQSSIQTSTSFESYYELTY